MTISEQTIKNIICRLLFSKDYRIEIVNLINAEFLQFAIEFFSRVAIAKYESHDITIEWYKKTFLNESLNLDEIAVNSGLNKKTISNMYGSTTRNIVIDANEHFDKLYNTIQELTDEHGEIDIKLNIEFNNVSVKLNISESLLVINTLAVKRAALRGGLWSTAGKNVEKYLMLTLCELFKVPNENYNATQFVKDKGKKVDREVDFYLLSGGIEYLCEIKLMGKGNPESADAIIARDTNVFIADTLSQQNKNQCDSLGIHWVCLREPHGYKRFGYVLEKLDIPHTKVNNVSEQSLVNILNNLLK
ncbi:MAG: CfrBI family restriction endonuclease [Candidatus Cloacimonetes bacterium]|nr:CfrBI family restriction endonuclease [Candidatus Cloacimonadota bacterium]